MQDPSTREKRQHSTAYLPYSYYDCRIPEYFNNIPMHWHAEFELGCLLEGSGEFICGDDRFTARKGDILLLPPNMLHAAYPHGSDPLIYSALVFHPSMLGANSMDRCTAECITPIINGTRRFRLPIRADRKHYPELKALSDRIFLHAKSNQALTDLLLKSELLHFFWLIEDEENPLLYENAKDSYHEMLRPVLEYMMENFQEPVTVEELAGLVHLSKSYFMGCFKKAVGISAMEHLALLRINAACKALTDTDLMISEISFQCGYSNLSNFNRQFLRITGCTPKEYRNHMLLLQ